MSSKMKIKPYTGKKNRTDSVQMETREYRPEREKARREAKANAGRNKALGGGKQQDFGRQVSKELGGKVNQKIDRGAQIGREYLKEGVGKIGAGAKKIGFSDNLVKVGSKELMKHGNRWISEAAGKTKNFIHTEGRNVLKQGVQKAKELGGKIKGKFEEWGNKLKRRR